MPPEPSVATHTLPSPSTAERVEVLEARQAVSSVPPWGSSPGGASISPGPATCHHHTQAV